jgi:hypothetical protein
MAAFEPRPKDEGAISAALRSVVTVEQAVVNPRDPSDRAFGLCFLDIEAMRRAANQVRVIHTGHGHVRTLGCESVVVRQALARLATVLIRPAARPNP